jgi:hypothetical protein
MTGAKAAIVRLGPIALAMLVIAATILAIGVLSSRSLAAGPEAAPSPHRVGYLPSISYLMIATIQPRHERLWRAEQDGDWEFAAYELGIFTAHSTGFDSPIQLNTISPFRS